jgi:ketose-bisphosphate aldolases
MHALLADAEKGGYALPAINFSNLEVLHPALEAAKELNSPLIMQMATSEVYYFGEDATGEFVERAAQRYGVRIALHLDHGREYEEAIRCIKRGFSSVMFDGSSLSFNDNVKGTLEVVKAAHAAGVSVEGEIGKILGAEDAGYEEAGQDELSDPQAAADFAKATGVDCLAVAIGTAHGFYKKEPKLDFDRLKKIRELTNNLPIVLHGGTGVSGEAIQQAIKLGVRKINFSTVIRAEYIKAFRRATNDNPEEWGLMELSEFGKAKVKETVANCIKLMGSANRVK